MKYSIMAGLTATLLAMSSCSTITQTAQTAGVDATLYNLTVADMDVSPQRVEHTLEWKWTPFKSVNLTAEKTNATAELLKQTNADVLVEPQYLVKRRGLFRGGSVTVSGHPATYKNYHPITDAEVAMIGTAEGRCKAYPQTVMTTTSTKPASGTPRRKPQTYMGPTRFLSILGGSIVSNGEGRMKDYFHIGLMYGRYGSRWGWYVKGDFSTAAPKGNPHGFDSKRGYGGSLTGGVIKTIGRHSTVMLGVGLGAGLEKDYDTYEEKNSIEQYFSVPVELSYKYSFSNFHLMAGCTYMPALNHCDPLKYGNYLPFVGFGITL